MSLPELKKLHTYSFEIGPIRPPSEGGDSSLLIRATCNCPWNLCKFCYGTPYNRERFRLRNVDAIIRDINAASALSTLLTSITRKLGGAEWTARVITPYFLYAKEFAALDPNELQNLQNVVNVFNWLRSDAKTAFVQDADSLIMPTNQLIKVLTHLKQTFPSLQRITAYARSATLAQTTKSLKELRKLFDAGLTRLHVGVETGDDELLTFVNKGVTSEDHVLAATNAKEAGLEVSAYWMPGLGGTTMSAQHAINTSRILNEINPEFIRSRRFVPRKATPLFDEWKLGKFELLSPHAELLEIKTMIERLNITGKVCFDHFINPAYKEGSRYVWLFTQNSNGYSFPEEKTKVLNLLEHGLEIEESRYVSAEDLIETPL